MDLLVIGVLIAALFVASTVAYLAGRDAAERKYHADLANARIAYKRLQRDLDHAREETVLVRRALRDKGTAA